MKKRSGARRAPRKIVETAWLADDLVRLTFAGAHNMWRGNVFPVAGMVFTVEKVPNAKVIVARKWPEEKIAGAQPKPASLGERLKAAARALAGRPEKA